MVGAGELALPFLVFALGILGRQGNDAVRVEELEIRHDSVDSNRVLGVIACCAVVCEKQPLHEQQSSRYGEKEYLVFHSICLRPHRNVPGPIYIIAFLRLSNAAMVFGRWAAPAWLAARTSRRRSGHSLAPRSAQ